MQDLFTEFMALRSYQSFLTESNGYLDRRPVTLEHISGFISALICTNFLSFIIQVLCQENLANPAGDFRTLRAIRTRRFVVG